MGSYVHPKAGRARHPDARSGPSVRLDPGFLATDEDDGPFSIKVAGARLNEPSFVQRPMTVHIRPGQHNHQLHPKPSVTRPALSKPSHTYPHPPLNQPQPTAAQARLLKELQASTSPRHATPHDGETVPFVPAGDGRPASAPHERGAQSLCPALILYDDVEARPSTATRGVLTGLSHQYQKVQNTLAEGEAVLLNSSLVRWLLAQDADCVAIADMLRLLVMAGLPGDMEELMRWKMWDLLQDYEEGHMPTSLPPLSLDGFIRKLHVLMLQEDPVAVAEAAAAEAAAAAAAASKATAAEAAAEASAGHAAKGASSDDAHHGHKERRRSSSSSSVLSNSSRASSSGSKADMGGGSASGRNGHSTTGAGAGAASAPAAGPGSSGVGTGPHAAAGSGLGSHATPSGSAASPTHASSASGGPAAAAAAAAVASGGSAEPPAAAAKAALPPVDINAVMAYVLRTTAERAERFGDERMAALLAALAEMPALASSSGSGGVASATGSSTHQGQGALASEPGAAGGGASGNADAAGAGSTIQPAAGGAAGQGSLSPQGLFANADVARLMQEYLGEAAGVGAGTGAGGSASAPAPRDLAALLRSHTQRLREQQGGTGGEAGQGHGQGQAGDNGDVANAMMQLLLAMCGKNSPGAIPGQEPWHGRGDGGGAHATRGHNAAARVERLRCRVARVNMATLARGSVAAATMAGFAAASTSRANAGATVGTMASQQQQAARMYIGRLKALLDSSSGLVNPMGFGQPGGRAVGEGLQGMLTVSGMGRSRSNHQHGTSGLGSGPLSSNDSALWQHLRRSDAGAAAFMPGADSLQAHLAGAMGRVATSSLPGLLVRSPDVRTGGRLSLLGGMPGPLSAAAAAAQISAATGHMPPLRHSTSGVTAGEIAAACAAATANGGSLLQPGGAAAILQRLEALSTSASSAPTTPASFLRLQQQQQQQQRRRAISSGGGAHHQQSPSAPPSQQQQAQQQVDQLLEQSRRSAVSSATTRASQPTSPLPQQPQPPVSPVPGQQQQQGRVAGLGVKLPQLQVPGSLAGRRSAGGSPLASPSGAGHNAAAGGGFALAPGAGIQGARVGQPGGGGLPQEASPSGLAPSRLGGSRRTLRPNEQPPQ